MSHWPELGDAAPRCTCCGRWAEETDIWGPEKAGVTCVEISAHGTVRAALCGRCQTALHAWDRIKAEVPGCSTGAALIASFMGADDAFDSFLLAHHGENPAKH